MTEHPFLGELELVADDGPDGAAPNVLFCDNETNTERLFGLDGRSRYPKDGINDHVVGGADTVNPERRGTKAAFHYRVTVPRWRDRASSACGCALRRRRGRRGPTSTPSRAKRRAEADEFYAELTPAACPDDEASVMRQAFAGMLWGKQLYYYDVERWLEGDPTQPRPPDSRRAGRNERWVNFEAFDIMSMPDPWEYPWFAAWDMAFHCVALAHIDPAFAKYQLTLLCREWFQHPNGALPAYEWSFDDVNPPVQAWAALQVFAIDEGRDMAFLSRIFDKLLVNFTWWVNREDSDGSNVFEGGFLGLDNIGPIDRSHLPAGYTLEQADATGWMAAYSLTMAVIAALLNRTSRPAGDLVLKFLEHFSLISEAMEEKGVWNEEDGFYYDLLRRPDGSVVPLKVRSMVGVLPMTAFAVVDQEAIEQARVVGKRFSKLLDRHDEYRRGPGETIIADNGRALVGVVSVEHLLRIFERLFDEEAFLSPHGLRALSRWHLEHPFSLDLAGSEMSVDYEPAESTTGMFGGNSNWRGPIWFPVNYLVVDALFRYSRYFGDELKLEYPTGSGVEHTLGGDRRGHPPPPDLPLPRRRGRAPSLSRLGRQAPARSALEGQRRLQRVLPRRQRGRARRLASDRVDGDRGRHDPPEPRRRHPDPRGAARASHRGGAGVIRLGPQACGTLEESSRREWLVTDGLGGYAMGTVAGLRTRRYHGLLVVADGGPSAGCSASPLSTRCWSSATPVTGSRPTSGPRASSTRGATRPRLVRARPGRSPLALAGRRHRARARDRHGPRPRGRRSRPSPHPRRPPGHPRAHGRLHLAIGARRAVGGCRSGGRVRLPRGSRSKGHTGLPGQVGGRVGRGTEESEPGRRPPAASMRSRTCGRRERSSPSSALGKPTR